MTITSHMTSKTRYLQQDRQTTIGLIGLVIKDIKSLLIIYGKDPKQKTPMKSVEKIGFGITRLFGITP